MSLPLHLNKDGRFIRGKHMDKSYSVSDFRGHNTMHFTSHKYQNNYHTFWETLFVHLVWQVQCQAAYRAVYAEIT